MYLVLYDISSDKIRERIAKRLLAEGYERIQLSVFTGLRNPKDNATLWKDLTTWLQQEPTAKCYALHVPPSNVKNMNMIGDTKLDIDYLLGLKNTIFI